MEDSCLLHLYMYYNIVDSIKKAAGGDYGSMSEMLVWPLTFEWGEAETVPSIIDQPSLITTLSVHLHKKPGNKPMSEHTNWSRTTEWTQKPRSRTNKWTQKTGHTPPRGNKHLVEAKRFQHQRCWWNCLIHDFDLFCVLHIQLVNILFFFVLL